MNEIGELYGGLSKVCADWERIHKLQRNTFFKNFRNMFGTSLYEEQGLEAVRNLEIVQDSVFSLFM